ncbi:hypothetical protein [Vibrio sp. D431a]|uniref:hypothetical protein n=1 Tax=Vibrio sp. D431a TaxID=2837388 RepID=UPI00255549F0|nr:hypothetical protein [Vibrio sp. D431a]MDK9789884.1 hypothetical protein [Vibrio sp. D431a]
MSNDANDANELTFEFCHPETGEVKQVTVSKKEVGSYMEDVLFDKLLDSACECKLVGETTHLDCLCYEQYEDFVLKS